MVICTVKDVSHKGPLGYMLVPRLQERNPLIRNLMSALNHFARLARMYWPKVRRVGVRASRQLGIQQVFRLSSQGPTVLFYHGVEPSITDPNVQALHLDIRAFERQIQHLRRFREIISVENLADDIAAGRKLDPRRVVLTFDDGYKNNLTVVAPMLQAWNLPFTVFVSTRHIDEQRRFPTYYVRAAVLYSKKGTVHLRCLMRIFDTSTLDKRLATMRAINAILKRVSQEKVDQIVTECREHLSESQWSELDARFASETPMTWNDVQSLSQGGTTISAHCHDHCILHEHQSDDEVRRQLRTSKKLIQKYVGLCRYMAYPNGTWEDISAVAYAGVKAEAYRLCFTTIEGEVTASTDAYLMPRVFAQPDFEEFCYLLSRTGTLNGHYRTACGAIRARTLRPAAVPST